MREIDRCIRECERLLDRYESTGNMSGAKRLVEEVYGAMATVPNIKHGLRKFSGRAGISAPYDDAQALGDLRILAGKLRARRDDLEHELDIARLNAAQRGATVVLNNSNSAVSESSATADVSISQTIESLDRCDASSEELRQIKSAVEDLAAAKGKSPETICDSASKVLDLAKKGVDVAKAVGPYVAMALRHM